jgi:hypothetical protein
VSFEGPEISQERRQLVVAHLGGQPGNAKPVLLKKNSETVLRGKKMKAA